VKFLSSILMAAGIVLALVCSWAAASSAQTQQILEDPPQPVSVPGHFARAKQIAGNEPFASWVATKGYWCMPPLEGRASGFAFSTSPDAVPPLQVFDNRLSKVLIIFTSFGYGALHFTRVRFGKWPQEVCGHGSEMR
jgi:hypothetical protein